MLSRDSLYLRYANRVFNDWKNSALSTGILFSFYKLFGYANTLIYIFDLLTTKIIWFYLIFQFLFIFLLYNVEDATNKRHNNTICM